MSTIEKKHIGELVAEDYRTASVFKKHKIDFCCNGGRSVEDACTTKGINLNEITDELEKAMQNDASDTPDFQSWPLDLLADYIEKKHHRYTEKRLGEILPFLEKLCKVHGTRHPELLEIKQLFSESAGELTQHMKKEELVLFPFVRKMVQAQQEGTTIDNPHFDSVENPIAMMMEEHDTEGGRFREIAQLTNDYTPPADACNTYRVTFAMLRRIQEDLHKHIHLENNILFPQSIELESRLPKPVLLT
ncbi:MAG: iron-sulfur cluster repair di-iron protein [Owenweeksia sp.]|nr:iron-sulfur cluster repair di-iron protein [Owenweeksia sp.]